MGFGTPLTPPVPAVVELCLSHRLGPVALANELLAFVTSKDLDLQLTPEGLDAFEHEVGVPNSQFLWVPRPPGMAGSTRHPPQPCPRCWPSAAAAAGAGGTSAGGSSTTSTRSRSCIPSSRADPEDIPTFQEILSHLGGVWQKVGCRELSQIPHRGLGMGGILGFGAPGGVSPQTCSVGAP